MKILAILALLGLASCASTAKDRYDDLMKTESCAANYTKINLSKAKPIGEKAKPTEGELNSDRCLVVGNYRTSYDIFTFVAKANETSIAVKVSPKLKGFGFGGEHSLALPVISIYSKSSPKLKTVAERGFAKESSVWSGDSYVFAFKLSNLVAGEKNVLILTSDNNNIGTQVTKENAINYGGASAGILLDEDTSKFIGPYGSVEVWQE